MGKLTLFQDSHLNEIGAELIDNYDLTQDNVNKVKRLMRNAICRRWASGKIIYENLDQIKEAGYTQRSFGEKIGVSEAILSNDKRAYKALLDEGVSTPEQLLEHLRNKGISTTTRQWEKLPKLLNDPQAELEKDRRAKDEKRLESIQNEVEEIRARNQSTNPHVFEKADETLDYTEGVSEMILNHDPKNKDWRSRKYLDYVKSLGIDLITGNPSDQLDPHHSDIHGNSKGANGKVADNYTIPVSRDTHSKIESGQLNPKDSEIAFALVTTMANFIQTHYD